MRKQLLSAVCALVFVCVVSFEHSAHATTVDVYFNSYSTGPQDGSFALPFHDMTQAQTQIATLWADRSNTLLNLHFLSGAYSFAAVSGPFLNLTNVNGQATRTVNVTSYENVGFFIQDSRSPFASISGPGSVVFSISWAVFYNNTDVMFNVGSAQADFIFNHILAYGDNSSDVLFNIQRAKSVLIQDSTLSSLYTQNGILRAVNVSTGVTLTRVQFAANTMGSVYAALLNIYSSVNITGCTFVLHNGFAMNVSGGSISDLTAEYNTNVIAVRDYPDNHGDKLFVDFALIDQNYDRGVYSSASYVEVSFYNSSIFGNAGQDVTCSANALGAYKQQSTTNLCNRDCGVVLFYGFLQFDRCLDCVGTNNSVATYDVCVGCDGKPYGPASCFSSATDFDQTSFGKPRGQLQAANKLGDTAEALAYMLTEKSADGSVVLSLDFQSLPWNLTRENDQIGTTNFTRSNYTIQVKDTLNSTLTIFQDFSDTTLINDINGIQVVTPPGVIKYSIIISSWAFAASDNYLEFTYRVKPGGKIIRYESSTVSSTANDGNTYSTEVITLHTETQKVTSNLQRFAWFDNSTLKAVPISIVEVDDDTRDYVVRFNQPFVSLSYDPDMGVALTGGAGGDGDSDDTLTLALAITLPVVVFFAGVVVLSVILIVVIVMVVRHLMHRDRNLGSAVEI